MFQVVATLSTVGAHDIGVTASLTSATVDVSGASTLTGAVQLGGDLDVPGVATLSEAAINKCRRIRTS